MGIGTKLLSWVFVLVLFPGMAKASEDLLINIHLF